MADAEWVRESSHSRFRMPVPDTPTSPATPSAYLPRSVRAREQAHRRAILIGIGALITMSTSPVFGHHLLSGTGQVFIGRDHIVGICLIALHELLAPVHFGFHVVLALGLGYATFDRLRAMQAARMTLGALDATVPSDGSPIMRAAAVVGLSRKDLCVIAGLPTPAFTAGWWRPRVYVAAEITELLDQPHLIAVLAHEAEHLRRRDPLRLSVLRFLACTLFYLPTFRRLADDAADEAEIIADDAAVRGHPLVLAQTLVLLATAWSGGAGRRPHAVRSSVSAFAVGFQHVGLIDRRVRRLVGEDVPIRTHVTMRSLVSAVALLVAIAVSGIVMAHPLAAQEVDVPHGMAERSTHAMPERVKDRAHCRHDGELAIAHLFCLGFHHHAADHPCPHASR